MGATNKKSKGLAELRRRYRRRTAILCAVALLAGMALGVLCVRTTSVFDSFLGEKTVRASGWKDATISAMAAGATAAPASVWHTSAPTPAPGQALTPVPSQAPGPTTREPDQTPAPIPSREPALTDGPDNTEEPGATREPGVTEEPGAAEEPEITAEPDFIPEPTSTPVPEPTPDPRESPVPYGQAATFETEILPSGAPRTDAAEESFSTLTLTMAVQDTLDAEYFAGRYGNLYRMNGDEACAVISLGLARDAGRAVQPGEAIRLDFETAGGESIPGFRLMDEEIAGVYNFTLSPGETRTLYQRFSRAGDQESAAWMVLTHYVDGTERKIYFSLIPDETRAGAGYPLLQRGSRGEEVKALQAALAALGYLNDRADGIFGGRTEQAVQAAQEHYGLEATGLADGALQALLFADLPEE